MSHNLSSDHRSSSNRNFTNATFRFGDHDRGEVRKGGIWGLREYLELENGRADLTKFDGDR